MSHIENPGFIEFLQESVQDILEKMPWVREREFILAKEIDAVSTFITEAINTGLCAVDLETTSLNSRMRRIKAKDDSIQWVPASAIVGISLCYESKKGMYIPVNHMEDEELNLSFSAVMEQIARLTSNCVTIYHNSKFDTSHLKNFGVLIDQHDKFEDTQLLARLYDAGQKDLKLKSLSENLLNQKMLKFEEVAKGNPFSLVSPKVGYIYATSDALCTFDLYKFFMASPVIQAQKSIYNLEKRVMLCVREMEENLIMIDVPYLKRAYEDTTEKIQRIEQEIYKLVGKTFNLGSPIQLGKILFEELKYKYPESIRTASGQYKTDNAVLEKIADLYPIVKKIIDYRSMIKVRDTYIVNLLKNHDNDGCVKLSFYQSGTDTGRFSSPGGKGINIDGQSGVNVQSIPKKADENIPDIRKAFIARPGYKMVAIDYENEELRVATNLSNETAWIEGIEKGIDFHTATGALVSGKKPEDLDPKGPERKLGKCVAKGTLIASDHGWIPIEEIKEGYRVITHTGELKKVEKVWDMGIKNGITIRTRTGHEITCGLNHRFMTPENKWVKAKDLFKGIVIKTISCDKIDIKSKQRVHFNVWNKGNNNLTSKELPYIEISPLWGRLIGYLLGDGCLSNENVRIVCSSDYKDIKNDIMDTAKKLGLLPKVSVRTRPRPDGSRTKPLYDITLGSRILSRFFKLIGFRGRRVTKKSHADKVFRVPKIIFKSSKKVKREFLRGLFEADGTADTETSITTKDRELAQDLILLLAEFNIRACSHTTHSKWYNRDYYRVSFGAHGSRIFEKKIGFISKRKKKKLKLITGKNQIYNSAGSYKHKWQSEIVQLKKVKKVHLMDLTVEGSRSYVAQGLVSHNTVNFLSLYLGGARTLAAKAKISEARAKDVLTTFFAGVPRLKRWINQEIKRSRKSKEVRTIFGRVRPLAKFYDSGDYGLESHGDRCVINTQIQGCCADIIKTVMARMYNWIHSNNLMDEVRILITMHDELVFEIKEDKMSEHVPKIIKIMMFEDVLQGMLKWPVPLTVDVTFSNSWRATEKFFKTYPEAEGKVNESVDFHFTGQIKSDRYAIAQNKEPDPVGDCVQAETQSVETVTPTETPAKPLENESVIQEDLIYTIRDRRKSTRRILNEILSFLIEDDSGIYTSPKKRLIIRDRDGNSLLVSEYMVPADSFLSLARYYGI